MKIAIIGTGYVGLVTATGLAELGHQVNALDIDQIKISKLKKGQMPFYEPQLKQLVIKNQRRGRLIFSSFIGNGISECKFIFICVGTPPKNDGSADLKYVMAVAKEIGKSIIDYKIVINKSTVPVGTGRLVQNIIKKNYHGNFSVISCPEFLREGRAIYDFFHPDRLVVGGDNKSAVEAVAGLFAKLKTTILKTRLETAELIKYSANAFLATKISFINEIANLCDRVGADVEEVALGMGLDRRIGQSFLKAGLGYGGSCFPKDVRALKQIAGGHGYNFHLLKAVIEVNRRQKLVLMDKLNRIMPNVKNKVIAILGLAFKDNTDDIRESAAIEIINKLKKRGAIIQAYDPVAMSNAKKIIDHQIKYCRSAYDASRHAQILIIATEWPQFVNLDWQKIKRLMKSDFILDGKNLLKKEAIKKIGFKYFSIGRS